MSQISTNSPRAIAPGVPAAKAAPGALDLSKLEGAPALTPDALSLAKVSAELPAALQGLAPGEREALTRLSPGARMVAFAELPADAEAAKLAVAKRLTDYAASRVPGKGATFEGSWQLADAAIAAETLDKMSMPDRARLEGVVFKRAAAAKVDDALQSRDSKGLASMAAAENDEFGALGKAGRSLVSLLEKLAFTSPLAALLVGWFPHAMGQVRNREITLGDAKPAVMREVLTHEIGHQVQFGPTPDLAEIKEWSKLSGWMDGPNAALGLGEDGELKNFDPTVRPTRTDNFVYPDFTDNLDPQALEEFADSLKDPALKARFKDAASVQKTLEGAIEATFGVKARGYAMTSPLEDFAESYRAFQNDPDMLIKQAPDKFLFLNANSRRFSPEQVAERFKAAGVDLKATATKLASVGLTQETLDKINRANGLTADVQVLGAQAEKVLKKDDVPAFQRVYLELQASVAAKDTAFLAGFLSDPAKALGETWGQLSEAEKAQFTSPQQRQELLGKLQRGQASYASAASEGLKRVHLKALQSLASDLVDRGDFRDALASDPERALAGNKHYAQLPPAVRRALLDPQTRQNLPEFTKALGTMLLADQTWLVGDGELRQRMKTSIAEMSEESLTVALDRLRQDPQDAAKTFLGINADLSAGAPAA